jgi:hypothetical protein
MAEMKGLKIARHDGKTEKCKCRRSDSDHLHLYYARLQYVQFNVSFLISYRIMSKWFSHLVYYLNLRHFVHLELELT